MSESLSDQATRGTAVFDLDYTLTKRGTWGRFVWDWVKFRPHIWLPLLLSTGWNQLKYKLGLCPRVDVKQAMMRWAMTGASRDKLIRKGQLFAEREFAKGLRPGALETVKMHRDQGDILIMISAAVNVIAEPMGKLLDFDYVVSTEMAFDDCNILKLNVNAANCYGGQKAIFFNGLIDKNPILKQYITNITFYSDSYSDLAMFRLANVCVAIHPDRKLSQHASEQGWRIEKW